MCLEGGLLVIEPSASANVTQMVAYTLRSIYELVSATTLIYTIGAETAKAAGTRLALQ